MFGKTKKSIASRLAIGTLAVGAVFGGATGAQLATAEPAEAGIIRTWEYRWNFNGYLTGCHRIEFRQFTDNWRPHFYDAWVDTGRVGDWKCGRYRS